MSVEVRIGVEPQQLSIDCPPPQSPAFIALAPGERLTIIASPDGNGFELERQQRQVHTEFNLNREISTVNYDSVTKHLAPKERIVLATLEDNMHSVCIEDC